MTDEGRLITFASNRDRGQVGRIGFDQEPLMGNGSRHVSEVFGLRESQDTGEGDVKSHVDNRSGRVLVSGIAVKDPARLPSLFFM